MQKRQITSRHGVCLVDQKPGAEKRRLILHPKSGETCVASTYRRRTRARTASPRYMYFQPVLSFSAFLFARWLRAKELRIATLRSCSALCAGDETIKEQREGCISVFGRASRAEATRRQSRISPPPFVVAMPDFRNALERSARTAKGRSGNSLAAVGILWSAPCWKLPKILLCRMPGVVTLLLLPRSIPLARKVIARVHEYRDAWFYGLHSFKPLPRGPLISRVITFTLRWKPKHAPRQSFTGIRGAESAR